MMDHHGPQTSSLSQPDELPKSTDIGSTVLDETERRASTCCGRLFRHNWGSSNSRLTRFLQYVYALWMDFTRLLRGSITNGVVKAATSSARYPWITLLGIFGVSVAMLVGGYTSNFTVRLDSQAIFTPNNSGLQPMATYQSRFSDGDLTPQGGYTAPTSVPTSIPTSAPTSAPQAIQNKDSNSTTPTSAPQATQSKEGSGSNKHRRTSILVHANGDDVFTLEGMERLFDVVDYMRATPGYAETCRGQEGSYTDFYGERSCEMRGATRLWHNNRTLFRQEVKTQKDLYRAFDTKYYPDGSLLDISFILARPKFDPNKGYPISGQAYFVWVYLKVGEELDDQKKSWTSCTPLECELADRFQAMRVAWETNSTNSNPTYVLEYYFPSFSFLDEALASILNDLPLLPCVFIVMSLFTCAVFFRCHLVHSRSLLLGVGAILTVFLSIGTAYGIMFLAGA